MGQVINKTKSFILSIFEVIAIKTVVFNTMIDNNSEDVFFRFSTMNTQITGDLNQAFIKLP